MSFLSVWERITSETEFKKMTHLAEFIGVTQQFVSKKKKEDDFPIEWAYRVAQKFNLSTEWILTGKGPKSLDSLHSYNFEILKELDEWLLDVVVNEPKRREWFSIAVQDAFPLFKNWKKRRDIEKSGDDTFPEKNVAQSK